MAKKAKARRVREVRANRATDTLPALATLTELPAFDDLAPSEAQSVELEIGKGETRGIGYAAAREAMLAAGFKPLPEEWWHFTLKDEPYPDTFFTFPVNVASVAGAKAK